MIIRNLPFGLSMIMLCACSKPQQITHTPLPVGELSSQALLAASCSGCHAEGNSTLVDLTDRQSNAIEASLLAYKRDSEGQTAMHRIARGYSDEEIAAIASYIGADGGAQDE